MRIARCPRHRRGTAALAAAALFLGLPAAALLLVSRAPADAVVIGNPVAGNHGFTVFVEHDAQLNSNEDEGTLALGGDLSVADSYRVANHPPTVPFTDAGDAQPTGLLVGGSINWAGGRPTGTLQVLSNSYVKVGSAAGTAIVNTGGPTKLVPTGAGGGSPTWVMVTTTQPTASVVRPGLIDFASAFDSYRARSAQMASCPDSVTPTNANGQPLAVPYPPGTQVYLTPNAGATSVWTVTAADLANVANITLRGTPTASAPLLVNVVGTGGVANWDVPSLGGFGGAVAPYVLWNFPDASTLTLTGANSVDGTVFAPNAALIDDNPGNVQGNEIVRSLVAGGAGGSTNGGEVHDFPFAGSIDCAATTPTTTTTAPATTTTATTTTTASTCTTTTTAGTTTTTWSTTTTAGTSTTTAATTTTGTTTTAGPTTAGTTSTTAGTSTTSSSAGAGPGPVTTADSGVPGGESGPVDTGGGQDLASTGAHRVAPLLLGAVALLVVGGLLAVSARRRRSGGS